MTTQEKKKRRELVKILTTETTVDCLDIRAYLALLQLKIEIGSRDLTKPLATLVKAWER